MPAFLEKDLRAEARRKGYKGKRADRYAYGAMNNIGAIRGNKETAKGRAMQAKHNRDHPAHHAARHSIGARGR